MLLLQSATAVFLITLGLGQLISVVQRWAGASLTGRRRATGGVIGAGFLVAGMWLLPQSWGAVLWTLPAALLTLGLLLWAGSMVWPLPNPANLFEPTHPAHGGCRRVDIPDGAFNAPGLLLAPPSAREALRGGVCIVPGAGDTKTSFKWLLVAALLRRGITVLTIDPPGHGEYRQRPMVYPDCLSTIPAAVAFLRNQPEIERVGVIGISLGGALAINALAEKAEADALVVVATPVELEYRRKMFYRELWQTYRSPILELMQETTAKQMREAWNSGGYVSPHTTTQLFNLLRPAMNAGRLGPMPVLLVYSTHDSVAPPRHGLQLKRAIPQADFLEVKKASHVVLTLMPTVNQQIAGWLAGNL